MQQTNKQTLINTLINKYFSTWRSVHISMLVCIVFLVLINIFALIVPVRTDISINASADTRVNADKASDLNLHPADNLQVSDICPLRSGFFKSTARLRNSMGDRTIKRVLSMLELKYVTISALSKKPVARIKIKTGSLGSARVSSGRTRVYKIGDTIEGMFKIQDIDVKERTVVIEASGKRVTLKQR